MNNRIAISLAAVAVMLPAGFGAPGAAMAQGRDCLSRQDIQAQLARGEIAPLADVMNREGIKERPLSVEVCDVNGQPHYIVNMMDSAGGTQSVTLNARGGSQ